MIALTRLATSSFVLIPPVFAWNDLRYPILAVSIAVAAVVEAVVVGRRLEVTGSTRDRGVLGIDVAFCLVLMLVGSRAADDASRGTLLTVLLPFALVCSALLGFGVRDARVAVGIVGLLGLSWAAALNPVYSLKIASDVLGFALWFVVGRLIAGELRVLASATAAAQARSAQLAQDLAASERDAAVQRERTAAHREIHDYLLPVVADVAADRRDPGVREAARQGYARARRFLSDSKPAGTPFRDGIGALTQAFPEVPAVIHIEWDPPDEVGDAVLAAAREALTNARRHAGGATNLHVEVVDGSVAVTVRDRGPGLRWDAVTPGGGLATTFPAVERSGGTVRIVNDGGTKILLGWDWTG